MAALSSPLSPSSDFSPSGVNSSLPRAVSILSNHSKRSRRSSSPGAKLDLTETHSEKKYLQTKADPLKALNEAQPGEPPADKPKKKKVRFTDDPVSASVALEESNLGDLRSMVHKDAAGNIITDPDRANPTRPRLERPLETIMSFQRDIDYTDHVRRFPHSSRPGSKIGFNPASDLRTEGSRGSGYYGGSPHFYAPQQRRGPGGGYYGRNISYGFRPENYVENGQSPNQYHGNRGVRNWGYGFNGDRSSPTHSHHFSYEIMTSGSEENSKTTNPSSVDSSSDRFQPSRKPGENGYEGSQMTSYGSNATNSTFAPHGRPQFMQNGNGNGNDLMQNFNSLSNGHVHQPNGNGPFVPPPANNPRVPIKLNSPSTTPGQRAAEAAAVSAPKEKRKSWLRRRFSRRES